MDFHRIEGEMRMSAIEEERKGWQESQLKQIDHEQSRACKRVREEKKMSKQFNDPACILDNLADTYRHRGERYRESFKQVGEVMKIVFPEKRTISTVQDFNALHLLMMIVVKLVRFGNQGMMHKDSIEDAAVYCAMMRHIIDDEGGKNGTE